MSAAIAKKKAFRGLISAGWGHLVVVDKNAILRLALLVQQKHFVILAPVNMLL